MRVVRYDAMLLDGRALARTTRTIASRWACRVGGWTTTDVPSRRRRKAKCSACMALSGVSTSPASISSVAGLLRDNLPYESGNLGYLIRKTERGIAGLYERLSVFLSVVSSKSCLLSTFCLPLPRYLQRGCSQQACLITVQWAHSGCLHD